MGPISAFELLFFAVFGMATHEDLREAANSEQPAWTIYLFKAVFGVYMLVSVVVLINLLIAMMSDTYQRIQVNKNIFVFVTNPKIIKYTSRTTVYVST